MSSTSKKSSIMNFIAVLYIDGNYYCIQALFLKEITFLLFKKNVAPQVRTSSYAYVQYLEYVLADYRKPELHCTYIHNYSDKYFHDHVACHGNHKILALKIFGAIHGIHCTHA